MSGLSCFYLRLAHTHAPGAERWCVVTDDGGVVDRGAGCVESHRQANPAGLASTAGLPAGHTICGGRRNAPWLLSQRSWQCTTCERPATRLSKMMGLLDSDDSLSVEAINVVPCLPSCDNERCWLTNTDACYQMARGLRNIGSTGTMSHIQSCEHCEKTTLFYTEDKSTKFKNCSRCLRVKYWCVLCPLDTYCHDCPSTLE